MLRSLLHLVMHLYNAEQWSSRPNSNIYIWFCSSYNGADSTSVRFICSTSTIQSINVDFFNGFNFVSSVLKVHLNFFRNTRLFLLQFVSFSSSSVVHFLSISVSIANVCIVLKLSFYSVREVKTCLVDK